MSSVESAAEWAKNADAWVQQDLALLTEADGWRAIKAAKPVELWSRPMPDDPNHLFRWRLPVVDAPAEVVFEDFVHGILAHHQEWTKEFVGGRVVEEGVLGTRILHQRFNPGIPGVAPRDLVSIEVVRDLGTGVKIASYRSVDRRVAREPGVERIDWWGAALSRTLPDGAHSELIYLDRENQGGWFPTWLMNRMMPGYLVLQAQLVQRFFAQQRGAAVPGLRPQ